MKIAWVHLRAASNNSQQTPFSVCGVLVIMFSLAGFRVWLPGPKHHVASVLVMNKDGNQQQPESSLNETIWRALGGSCCWLRWAAGRDEIIDRKG